MMQVVTLTVVHNKALPAHTVQQVVELKTTNVEQATEQLNCVRKCHKLSVKCVYAD